MSNLEEMQSEFIKLLLNKNNKFDSSILTTAHAAGYEIEANERIEVHRQTILENLINSLAIIYPGTWKLLGNDCARGCALSYIHEMKYLPKDGRMHDFGQDFPTYLASFAATKNINYIQDFASYELIKSKSYHASTSAAITFNDLQNYDEEELESACLRFNDSVMLLQTNYPVDAIQMVVENPDSAAISIERGEYFYLIYQNQAKLVTSNVNRALWRFTQYLKDGKKLGEVVEKLSESEGFCLSSAIGFIINNNLLLAICH